MRNFIKKAIVLLSLLTVAVTATNPSLRANPRDLYYHAITKHEPLKPPHRNLHNNNFPDNVPKNLPVRQLQPSPPDVFSDPAAFPAPSVDPELCREATALELGDIAEGTMDSLGGVWYSIVGTGGYLAASSCTGDSALDAISLDTVISVYSGSCDSLNSEAYDDDAGSCGNMKSAAYFPTVSGDTYYLNVMPFSFSPDVEGLAFGLKVTEIDVPPNTMCEAAVSVEIDEVVVVEPTTFGSSWYSVRGTGGYLAVSICTSIDMSYASSEVYSGSCDNLIYSTGAYGSEGNCGIAYFEASADETYLLSVYGSSYDGPTTDFTIDLKVYEVDELPNNICLGANPLELNTVVEGEITMASESAWYSLVGTGDDLVISTCTGDSTLDATPFDSVIEVYARDCDDLRLITSDDEGGKCGNGKSAVILRSVDGLVYHINVYEYMSMPGTFGIKVSAATS